MHTAVQMWILVLAICKFSRLGADGKSGSATSTFSSTSMLCTTTLSSSWIPRCELCCITSADLAQVHSGSPPAREARVRSADDKAAVDFRPPKPVGARLHVSLNGAKVCLPWGFVHPIWTLVNMAAGSCLSGTFGTLGDLRRRGSEMRGL